MIEVSHRGYTIRYADNADEWTCYDVQDAKGRSYSSPKLSNVKAAIDKMLLDVRKSNALACFELGIPTSFYGPKKTAAKIIEYVERKVERDHYGKKPDTVRHIVASVAQRGSSERAARRNEDIDKFMPDTPEAHEAFARFEAAAAREREAHAQTQAAFAAIPRVTVEMISELVRVANDAELGRSSLNGGDHG